ISIRCSFFRVRCWIAFLSNCFMAVFTGGFIEPRTAKNRASTGHWVCIFCCLLLDVFLAGFLAFPELHDSWIPARPPVRPRSLEDDLWLSWKFARQGNQHHDTFGHLGDRFQVMRDDDTG